MTDSDFTHAHYREILSVATKRFRFVQYGDALPDAPSVIWRHDVDASMKAAADLADIEAGMGIKSTYFLLLGCPHYNLFEAETMAHMQRIRASGHAFGIHLDVSLHNIDNASSLEAALHYERSILEAYVGQRITAFSFHNPTNLVQSYEEDSYAGLINTYGRSLKAARSYCSDSNGTWHHRRLWDVVNDPSLSHLHVLTHPEWWIAEPKSARQKIFDLAFQRASTTYHTYCQALAQAGRANPHPDEAVLNVFASLGSKGERAAELWLLGEHYAAYLTVCAALHSGADLLSTDSSKDDLAKAILSHPAHFTG